MTSCESTVSVNDILIEEHDILKLPHTIPVNPRDQILTSKEFLTKIINDCENLDNKKCSDVKVEEKVQEKRPETPDEKFCQQNEKLKVAQELLFNPRPFIEQVKYLEKKYGKRIIGGGYLSYSRATDRPHNGWGDYDINGSMLEELSRDNELFPPPIAYLKRKKEIYHCGLINGGHNEVNLVLYLVYRKCLFNYWRTEIRANDAMMDELRNVHRLNRAVQQENITDFQIEQLQINP